MVSAKPALFKAHINTHIIPQGVYQLSISFGNKVVYFDPKDLCSVFSSTLAGVFKHLRECGGLEYLERVIEDVTQKAKLLVDRMCQDDYAVSDYVLHESVNLTD